jgi:hypothetical protein
MITFIIKWFCGQARGVGDPAGLVGPLDPVPLTSVCRNSLTDDRVPLTSVCRNSLTDDHVPPTSVCTCYC